MFAVLISFIFICILFNSSAESIIFQSFTAEVSNRSSLVLKLPFAVQLTGRQANVTSELLVTSFLNEKQNKNEFKAPIRTGGFGGKTVKS